MKSTTRRKFVKSSLAAAAGAAVVPPASAAPAKRKNVLFIGVDDLATQLGCYGRPVHSPNLDRLAARGVRFDSAHCQFPLCSPSRSSLMTGVGPDSTRVWDLSAHFREALPHVVTLGQLFRMNGYFSARVGKIYHAGNPGEIGTDGLDDPMTWDYTFNPVGVDHTREEPLVTNFTPKRGLGSAIAFHKSDAPDDAITDALGAAEVIRLLKRPHEKPFFIAYGLYRPHVPWVVPKSYFDLYPLDTIEPDPFDPSELKIAPPPAYWTQPPNFGMDIKQRKQAIQGYYAATTFMDAQVGKVLHALKASGHAENTLVVFWVDHGWQLGQHGQWMKDPLFEDATRVPLIFSGAGVSARGKVCKWMVENLDIYPSVASICGLSSIPATLHGQSLTRLLHNPETEWSKPAVTQVVRNASRDYPRTQGYSIREERYRYTWWDEGKAGEELYDYQTDPLALKNRVHDAALKSTRLRLRVALNEITRSRGRIASARYSNYQVFKPSTTCFCEERDGYKGVVCYKT